MNDITQQGQLADIARDFYLGQLTITQLSEKYQLSQEEAQSIADISDNVEYTKNVMLVLQKLGLGSWEFPNTTQTVTAVNPAQNTENLPEELPDPLPEEKEIQQ